MSRLVLIIISVFTVLTSSPALAKDVASRVWVVSQLSGDARVVRGGLQPASLKVSARLAPGDMVVTGANGRATLARGADYIVMAPRSELRLPATPQPNGFTRVMQNLGTLLFKVQHTGVPHFAVDTPMLAAVVKGTTFTVIVDRNRSAVQVTEGAVEVAAIDGGMKQLVEGGRTVFINHSNPKTLLDADASSPAATSTSSNAVKITGSDRASLASIAGLTAGLVRAEVAPQSARPVATIVPVTAAATTATGGAGTSLPAATPTTAPGVEVAEPVAEIVDTTVPGVTKPVVNIIDATLPTVTQPVVDIVDPTVPAVTQPVVDIVETTLPTVTQPVVDIVDTTLPAVTQPVVDIVETTLPAVTQPVLDIVETTLPAVTQPVVDIVETTLPPVTQPVVNIVETTVPVVTQPVVNIVETTVPTVTQPVVNIIETTVPKVTAPVVNLLSGLKF